MLRIFRTRDAAMDRLKEALGRSQAIIEFALDGTILTANENFLRVMGYTLAEIQGKHHSMFVEPALRDSPAYRDFWAKLARGEFQAGQFKRVAKGGKEVWIEATYNHIFGPDGRPLGVMKCATDVTDRVTRLADLQGKVDAIRKSQAEIEFALDGTVLSANENFLRVMGYTLAEIQGRHHSMFVDRAFRDSPAYRAFWDKLGRGEYEAGQFKRIGKGGKEVWIEASYNPVLGPDGKPCKVVKYATDITRQVTLLNSLKTLIDRNFAEVEGAVGSSEDQAGTAQRAAAETSASVQMVASSAEELAASIREISESMVKSRSAAEHAVERAGAADTAAHRLADLARSMTGIVDLIQTIAGQINLLALNATIESARAGEAGKGFAVVASEVKSLARQAAEATGQIAREIGGIQSVSVDVVTALADIRDAIGTVREYVSGTAAAVEEQSAVTRDMSQTMQGAASGVEAVNGSIGHIVAALGQVSGAVNQTKEAAQVLAR